MLIISYFCEVVVVKATIWDKTKLKFIMKLWHFNKNLRKHTLIIADCKILVYQLQILIGSEDVLSEATLNFSR